MAAAPRFVLLERRVEFVVGEGPTGGGASEKAAIDILKKKATAEAAVQAMKPDPSSFFEPPAVSRLTMVQQTRGVPVGYGFISGTDKALVVLYADTHAPSGCYLVYDASTNSLSAVPQIPPSPYFSSLGYATAILSRGGGAYVIAEIGTGRDDEGTLYLWQCTSPNQISQWDRRPVRLPPQVIDDLIDFSIDTTFSYADSSSICWVDLLKGVLFCDLIKAEEVVEEPQLTFIPLPEGYSIDFDSNPRPRPEYFRTMSCVNGVIKFVALVGLYENNFAGDDVVVEIWTLSPDLREWKLACNPLAVQDLWAGMSYRTRNLPKIPPMYPLLSFDEDEVVYLSLKEIERNHVYDVYGQFEGVQIVTKAHHVLRVDVIQNKVLDCTKYTQGTLITTYWPIMLATDFTSYLHDNEGEREKLASMEGTSGKPVNN